VDDRIFEALALIVEAGKAFVSPGQYQQNDCELLDTTAARIRALAMTTAEPRIPGAVRTAEESARAYQTQPTAAVEGLWEDYLRCLPGAESRLVDYTKALERECLARRDADLTAINARDAADIVRPPETERRECWGGFVGQTIHCLAPITTDLKVPPDGERVHLVELRPGEQVAPPGAVVLTAEQSERVLAVCRASDYGEWLLAKNRVQAGDLAALGIEVDR